MTLFNHIGIEAYFATIVLNIIIDTCASLFLLYRVKVKTGINYFKSIKTFIKVILCTAIMVLGLSIINLFIPNVSPSRFISILYIILYGIIGVIIYFFVAYKSNTLAEIFGKDFLSKIKAKIPKLKVDKK